MTDETPDTAAKAEAARFLVGDSEALDMANKDDPFRQHRLFDFVDRLLKDREQRKAAYEALQQRLAEAEKAGGFCEQHKPSGGTRSCLVCGCIRLSSALSRIDYAVGGPNEYGVSQYDAEPDEERVVQRVENVLAARDREAERMRPIVELSVKIKRDRETGCALDGDESAWDAAVDAYLAAGPDAGKEKQG
jgi:hypothetical protein